MEEFRTTDEKAALELLKNIFAGISTTDESLANDFKIAIENRAWMLAFLAICIRLDILASEYYFNEVFSKKTSIDLMLAKFKAHMDAQKIVNAETLWGEILAEFEEYCIGKSGKIYRRLISDLSKEKKNADKIYNFRCSMAHSYSPNTLVISHELHPVNDANLFVERDGITFLHLDRFSEFHSGIHKQIENLSHTAEFWWSVRPKLKVV